MTFPVLLFNSFSLKVNGFKVTYVRIFFTHFSIKVLLRWNKFSIILPAVFFYNK